MAFRITYDASEHYYNPQAVKLFEQLINNFGDYREGWNTQEQESRTWEDIHYQDLGSIDHFEARTPAGKLWLMLNAPEGYTILEDT